MTGERWRHHPTPLLELILSSVSSPSPEALLQPDTEQELEMEMSNWRPTSRLRLEPKQELEMEPKPETEP